MPSAKIKNNNIFSKEVILNNHVGKDRRPLYHVWNNIVVFDLCGGTFDVSVLTILCDSNNKYINCFCIYIISPNVPSAKIKNNNIILDMV